MTDLTGLMKQVQQMQEQMQKAQAELAQREIVGEAGAGLVKVTLNGRYEAKKVELDSSLMTEDKEVLEDLLAAAINAASRKIAESSNNQLSGMASGLNLPDGFKFPF
jgi:DNA-binding YbaB/EbfC family protein